MLHAHGERLVRPLAIGLEQDHIARDRRLLLGAIPQRLAEEIDHVIERAGAHGCDRLPRTRIDEAPLRLDRIAQQQATVEPVGRHLRLARARRARIIGEHHLPPGQPLHRADRVDHIAAAPPAISGSPRPASRAGRPDRTVCSCADRDPATAAVRNRSRCAWPAG